MYKPLLIVFLLLFAATSVASKGAAELWLQRMNNALYNLDYEGHFVYLHDNSLEGMRISHHFEDGLLKARLLSLNGAQREVIREANTISIIRHEAGKLKISQRQLSENSGPLIQIEPDKLKHHYLFKLEGKSRVAGRIGLIVMVEPKDNFRYGYRLVLDQNSGLPLDVMLMDENNQLVSHMMFTDLIINPNADGHKKVTDVTGQQQGGNELMLALNGLPVGNIESQSWVFEGLPPGYVQTGYTYRRTRGVHQEVEHFVFSDGLATISLYVEKLGRASTLKGKTSLGSINAIGKTIKSHQLTVVGEAPEIALQHVLNSLRRKND